MRNVFAAQPRKDTSNQCSHHSYALRTFITSRHVISIARYQHCSRHAAIIPGDKFTCNLPIFTERPRVVECRTRGRRFRTFHPFIRVLTGINLSSRPRRRRPQIDENRLKFFYRAVHPLRKILDTEFRNGG